MAQDEYNPDDFEVLKVIGKTSGGKPPVTVSLTRYKDFDAKVKLARSGVKKDGSEYSAKLGGLTAAEALELSPLLVEAAKQLSKL